MKINEAKKKRKRKDKALTVLVVVAAVSIFLISFAMGFYVGGVLCGNLQLL